MSDTRGEFVKNLRCQVVFGLLRHVGRIADNTVAHEERLLGGFHDTVKVFKGLCLLHPEPLEDRKDHQRGEALRRRREIVERRALDRDRQRFAALRLLRGEIDQ